MSKLLEDIRKYWTNRAEGYSKVNIDELHSTQKQKWQQTILQELSSLLTHKKRKDIHILDIGTGPGFFAIILSELGFTVTAIDYTEEMLKKAKANAGKYADKIDFRIMDAQKLAFADNSFDIIVTRNLTWNLENPQEAYTEWYRVLKDNGLLLNFDANWYSHLFDPQKRQAYELDRKNVASANLDDHYTCTDIDTMEQIARQVPLSNIIRPLWDKKILTHIGFSTISLNTHIWQKVWSNEEKINYASTPMFLINAIK